MKKFIFLDIDGVLNSEKFFVARANSKESPKGMLDADAVKLLNKITDTTGADILYNTISEFRYVEDIHIYVKHDIDDADFKFALQYPNYEITEEMVERLTKVDPTIKDYGDEYVGTVYALEWEDRVYYVEYCKNADKWLIFTNIDNSNTVADFYKTLNLFLQINI